MMNHTDQAFHALGVVALLIFGGAGYVAGLTMIDSVAHQWRRILRLAMGHVEASPAASDAPHASAPLPQRRGDEAAAAPAIQVRG